MTTGPNLYLTGFHREEHAKTPSPELQEKLLLYRELCLLLREDAEARLYAETEIRAIVRTLKARRDAGLLPKAKP